MRITQPNAIVPRESLPAMLDTLVATIADQVSLYRRQNQAGAGAPDPTLAAIADNLAATLDLLQRAQEDLATQGDDVVATLNALDRVRRRYHDLFELAPDAYLVTDADGRILEANQAAIRLLGYSRTYAYGRSLLTFVAPGSAHAVSAHLHTLQEAASDDPETWKMMIRARGRGPHRAVQARVRRVTVHDGSHASLLWSLRRIPQDGRPLTPVDPAARADTIVASLSVALQTVPDATLLLDANGQILGCNAATVRLLGPIAGRPLGDILRAVVHPDDGVRATRALLHGGRPAAKRGTTQFRLRRTDGAWRAIEAAVARIPAQLEIAGTILSLRDVTEHLWTRRALERFYAYRAVAEALIADPTVTQHEGAMLEKAAALAVPVLADECRIYLRDADGLLRPAAVAGRVRTSGPPSEEDVRPILSVGEGNLDAIEQVLHRGEPLVIPEPGIGASAMMEAVEGRTASDLPPPTQSLLLLPLHIAGNEAAGVLMFRCGGLRRRYGEEDRLLGQDLARQVSLLIAQARSMQQARPLDAVTRALAGELRDELARTVTGLHASLDRLRASLNRTHNSEEEGDDGARDESLTRMAADVDRLGSQVSKVLDLVSDTEGEVVGPLQPVAVVELVQQVIAEQQGRPIQVFAHGGIPTVRAHPERLRLALHRVVECVEQSATPNVPLHVRITATSAAVAITVAASRNGGQVLHAGQTPLSPDGVLYVARSIVEAHGGTLACASTGDGGRAVTVTLPAGVEIRHEHPNRPERRQPGSGGRISHREREVLGLLEQGLTNRQIAEHLFLSERTVEHHISRMLARFRLSTRTHLAAYALKHDLSGGISPDGG